MTRRLLIAVLLCCYGHYSGGLAQEAPVPDTLLVGYKISPPFVTEKDGRLVGPSVRLWEDVAAELGITYAYQPANLDALLRGLTAGTLDVVISPLTITSDRAEQIHFSVPYYIAHSALLTKETSSWRQFLSFVDPFFSINFFRALGALALVILIFGLLVWLFERRANPEEFEPGVKGLWHGFWWSAVTMTTVGYGDKSPRSLGGRLVALVWMFTAIMIISGFTASIASTLTVDRIGASGESLTDFKEKTIGTIAASGTDAWLRNKLYTNRKTYPDLAALQQALLEDEVAAVAHDQPILQTLVLADSTTHFRLLEDEFNAQFYALGLRKTLPYALENQINIELLRQIERQDWEVLLAEYGLR